MIRTQVIAWVAWAVLGIGAVAVQAQNQAPGLNPEVIRGGNLIRPVGFSRGTHEPFTEPMTAAKIRTAVEDGLLYLRGQQREDGSMEDPRETWGRHGGSTGLAVLALLAAGADPAADDQVKKAMDWLATLTPDDTYVRAVRANVWEYALRKLPGDATLTKRLKDDCDWLLKALGNKEGWRYTMESADWDNSCTQYGVLGIWAGARAGLDPGEKFWQTMSAHFRGCQGADGGWGYTTGGSSPNMATAGLASLFLVFDMYHGKSFYSAKNPRTFTEGDAAAVIKAMESGMAWLGKHGGGENDAYYLYGIERAGVASGRKYFGGRDWFKEGALSVLRNQLRDGSLANLGSWGGGGIKTSFATLFLVYGGAPVAYNKLQFGAEQDWNLNPRDLANVSKYLWSAYESPLNWQSVSIDDKPEEFEAPILYLSGSKAAAFTEEQVAKLRQYVLRGGTLFAEPADHSEAFAKSMEELVGKLFPREQFTAGALAELPADHGVYTVLKQDWKSRPKLRGVSDGSRTVFFLSDGYLAADWQLGNEDSDAFKLAMNLLFYATDLGTLEGKFASILPNTAPAKPRDPAVSATMARVKHVSAAYLPGNWNAAAGCWAKLAPYVKHVSGCELKEVEPVALGESKLDGIRLLHITGRAGLKLTDREKAALKKYVEDGGTVLVDSYAGNKEFADAARKTLEDVFGKLEPLGGDHTLAAGRFTGGQDLARVGFKLPTRQLLRARGQDPQGQKLLVANVGKRPAVLFSEFDLCSAMAGIENYKSNGYKPASARRIVGNIVAYLMAD